MSNLTRPMLADDLAKLGVRRGDCVMLHSALSSLGHIEGGAPTVVEALIDAVGPQGTLLTPAFTEGAWKQHLAMPDCQDCPGHELCLSQWPSHQGAIPNAALNRSGSLRSCHPTHSWVANGARAAEILRDHQHGRTFCGHGNPFEKLVDLDGCIVSLGVGVNSITLWHYFEDILDVPYLGHYHPNERHLSYCTAGRRIQYEFPGIMQEVVKASGIMTSARVGRADSGLIRARTFRKFMAAIIAHDPYCFILRPPDRHTPDLAIDALQKAAAMLRAWATPQGLPDTIDWPPGNDDDLVRVDCPAFAGYHQAGGTEWPLCRANDRHPDLFSHGGPFNRHGKTTCGRCPWHFRYQVQAQSSKSGAERK